MSPLGKDPRRGCETEDSFVKSWWLITLLSLTIIVASPQAPLADESGSSDDRAPSSSEREPLTPLAKQLIEAAKTRLDAEQKANAQKTERARETT